MAAPAEVVTHRATVVPEGAPLATRHLAALILQAKLSVGAADDPYEREADAVAARVVRSLRAATTEPNRAVDGTDAVGARVQRSSHSAANSGAEDADQIGRAQRRSQPITARGEAARAPISRIQRAPFIGADGGDLDADTERMISSTAGGKALPTKVSSKFETAFGADFSAIRVHEGRRATDLNDRIQAKAFTTGNNIFFRDGVPDTSTVAGQSLLAHELTHTIQQGSAPLQRTTDGHHLGDIVDVPAIGPTPVSRKTIQRHASWEHKMLGDVSPDALQIMGAARNAKTGAPAGGGPDRGIRMTETEHSSEFLKVTDGPDAGKIIDQELVLHTIEQEIRRLEYFRDAPPVAANENESERLAQQDRNDRYSEAYGDGDALAADLQMNDDRTWQVRLVEVSLHGGVKEVVTYGELNTLADFYGSTDELRKTDPKNFHRIIQGIRQESLFKFMKLFEEISGTKKYQKKVGFDDAIGNTGTGDLLGEARLAGMVPFQEGKKKLKGQKATAYDAGLGRNACHFAPESWHSWAAQHKKARALASEAWSMTEEADDMANGLDEHLREALHSNAAKKTNEALIENGFGDHFLQDSYAAGHLINKTQIMQWYVQWLDTKKWKSDHASAEGWRHIQQIAYGQGGLADTAQLDRSQIGTTAAIDPQSVENQGGDWQSRFSALGLKIPGSVTPGSPIFGFTVWWQGRAARTKKRSLTMEAAMKEKPGLSKGVLEYCLRTLIDDGVAKVDGAGIARGAAAQIGKSKMGKLTYELRESYIPKDSKKFDELMQVDEQTGKRTDKADETYAKEMAKITYADYHKFLNNGFIQAASNVLHDRFCKNGLSVSSNEGDVGFRIYGDNAMLQKESSKGLVHSATTANMSRDSIYSIIRTGASPHTLNNISDRFPNQIEGQPLIDWHKSGGPLEKICYDEVFPEAQSDFVKGRLAGVFKSKLTKKISKDDTEDVHAGEYF